MRGFGIVVGLVLVFVGGVWFLQGVNSQYAPQSFMTGSTAWVIIGLVTAAGGGALAWWSRRRT